MSTHRFTTAALLLALSGVAPALHAEPVSRATLIARALRGNPQVAAAGARRAQARAEQLEADSARWPQISLDVGVGPSLRADLVPGSAVESTRSRYAIAVKDLSVVIGGRLSVVQPLYTFGKIDGFRAAASHQSLAREAQTQMTRAEVALDVARLYETLLFTRDATRFFEELENYVDRTILSTEERVQAGSSEVSEQDVMRLQTALAAIRLSLHFASGGHDQAQAGIVAHLGLQPGTELEPQESELEPLRGAQADGARLVATALQDRPELLALRQGALAYDSLAGAEGAGSLPDVFLMGFADGAYTPGRDLAKSRYVSDPLYHFDPGVLLGLRWQLQGSMARGRAERRRAQARELRELSGWAVAGLPAQVQKALADFKRAQQDLAEARPAVRRAKRWMVQASSDYTAGLADSRSLVDAVRAYAELRAAELDAICRHNVALAELGFATGNLIEDKLGLYPGPETP